MRTYFVCPAPSCPNGKLHLGHVGGVYLLADIFVRFQRMAGHRAHFITGADEHGTYTLQKARKLGQPVGEVAQKYIDEILQCLRAVHITPDVFVRTSSELHKENALAIFCELQEAGYVKVRKGVQLYCEHCDEFVADSLAVGNCPACNSPTDSNLCENCGLAVRHATLRNARHTTCGHNLVLRTVEHAVFDTPRLAHALDKAIGQSDWAEPIRDKARSWLAHDMRGLPMSRHFSHGIELLQPERLSGQTLLTWFEGLWCFDTGIREQCANEFLDAKSTMHDPTTRLVFFMGQDNRFYYTIGVTGALLARGYPIPANHSIQDFYKLEGETFSTSRDHALWVDEVAREVDPNVVRYALARIARPFGRDENEFDIDRLITAASHLRVWEDALGQYANNARTLDTRRLRSRLRILAQRYADAIEDLRFWDALDIVDRYFEVADFARDNSGMWNAVEISLFLSLLYPVVPELALRYGRHFFGTAWQPSFGKLAPKAGLPPKIDFPLSAAVPTEFIAAYNERFRRRQAHAKLAGYK
ncbi:class I tRNA ligase family protein [Bradyrhizobium sp. CCGUVB4N]|uniref:class I tRNA ligase family protein n=1 Tax=Bradyrhizobium sp. CCGUVB4N TaxID=2949631 RepID=UPI0020B444E5|nr:class I tRNA ligase family protein [Bradyrhizobium sp. CCGUVB4N]MCP3380384.1 class I tRNA ligase family protein [Bradyrhizobium sp. CCGUVB4N]